MRRSTEGASLEVSSKLLKLHVMTSNYLLNLIRFDRFCAFSPNLPSKIGSRDSDHSKNIGHIHNPSVRSRGKIPAKLRRDFEVRYQQFRGSEGRHQS
jgi:hypothetical protein